MNFKGNNKCINKCMMNYFKKYKNIEVNIIWVIVKYVYYEICIWLLYSVVINVNVNCVLYFYCNFLRLKLFL